MTTSETRVSEATTPEVTPHTARKAAIAGGVGTLIEYYDFSAYAFLAITIAPLFFPSDDSVTSLLLTLAVFGSSYAMRPLGGWFFGQLGDRRGRKTALVATVIAMGVACALLGLLPTYGSIGILAPILLVALRLTQGFCAGGEIGGAATYVAESSPENKRGVYGSLTPIGSTLGFAVAAGIVGLLNLALSAEAMASWGWRIPFLISIPLTALCLLVRLRLEDSPDFVEMANRQEIVGNPIVEVVRDHWRSVLKVVGLAIAMNGTGYVGLTYFNIYLGQHDISPATVSLTAACGIALACASFLVAGRLTDRLGRRPVLFAAYVLFAAIAWPVFAMLGVTTSVVAIGAIYFGYMFVNGLAQVPAFPLFTELFPRRVRYTGVALGFNIGTIVAGGSAPYICAQLVEWTGNSMAPAFWVIGVSLIGILTVSTLRETSREKLPV